jgi:hypothetical protein
LLHRRPDLSRRHRRIGIQRLLVEVAVLRINLPLGQRDGLAAEAADLLQPSNSAGDILRGGAANLILGRAVGKIFGHDLVKPFVDNRRIDPGLHSYVDLEKADAVERLQPGGNRHGQLFFADQDPVEARAG